MKYGVVEREVIGLCICLEAVSDIANHALLELREVSEYPGETEVYFHSSIHQQLFLIRMLDFAKEGGDSLLTGVTGSCVSVLKSACNTKSFDTNGSIDGLQESVEEFDQWLSYKTPIKMWLPSLNIEANIEVSRLEFLNIAGNYSKHNLSRLTGVSKDVNRILTEHGYTVSIEHIPLALDDFREHLEENYFIYYGTWLAELTNNIRWGIQSYLEPVFSSSYQAGELEMTAYTYAYPQGVQHDVPRIWFWRLMNNIRARPYLKKFVGAHYFKNKSSLEWIE